jgi:hypothetical protein
MPEKFSSEGLKAAADMTKQIITLSTGVIALTITFLEKITKVVPGPGGTVPWTLFAAWIVFGLTILAAVVTLGAVTGTLDALDRKLNGLATDADQNAAIEALCSGTNIRVPARLMSALFVIGMLLTIATGFLRCC